MKKNHVFGHYASNVWRKTFKVMKLTVLLVLLGIFSVSAEGFAQGGNISLKMEHVSLEDILQELKAHSEYTFVYSDHQIENVKVDLFEVKDANLEVVMNECLQGTDLEFYVENDVVVIRKKTPVVIEEVKQEKKTIKGTVIDVDGKPLPGVSVVVKGSTVGAATDIDGNYSIQFEGNNAVLVFSFVGMISQEIVYSGQGLINVELQDDSEGLDEVVVTGYQTISKERATGSFSILSPEKLESKLQPSLKSSLEGQVAGLVIDKEGNIEIRGIASFRADNSPLIVVDGFPFEGTLESLNPNNIANITVLKDAVSASIYGARSGNGVIVVTTKKGRKGENRISYKGSIGVQLKSNLSYLNRTNSVDYIDAEYQLYQKAPGDVASRYNNMYSLSEANYIWVCRDLGEISETEANEKIEKLRNTNGIKQIEDELLRPKIMQQHNLLISSGSDKNIFNFSLNYNSNKNETLYDRDSRLILDVKDEWYFNDKIKLNFLSNIYYTKGQKPNESVYQFSEYTSSDYLKPYSSLLNPTTGKSQKIFGVNPKLIKDYENKGLKNLSYNPMEAFGDGLIKEETLRARVGGGLSVQLSEEFSFSMGYTFTKGFSSKKQRYSAVSFKMRKLFSDASDENDPSIHYIPDGDMIKESRDVYYDYTLRGQLNYKKEFTPNYRLTAITGVEKRRNVWDHNNIGTRYGYNDISGTFSLVNEKALVEKKNSTQGWLWLPRNGYGKYEYKDNRYVSFYGNVSCELFNKYIVSSSVRVDQSNLFGTDPKYKYTPLWSVGFNYKLSEEKFFDLDFVDNLQLRASYGINGNVARDNGPYLIIRPSRYSDKSGAISYVISSPPNNSLRWERTKSYNFGADAALFSNRLFIAADYYVKNSDDLLARDKIDPTHGFSSVLKNIGEIQNKGLELTLNSKNLKTENFEWSTNLSMSFNKSKVVETNVKLKYPDSYMYTSVIVKGRPLNSLFQYKFAGLSDKGSTLVYNKKGEIIPSTDVDIDDVEYAGTTRPKYVASLINNFKYRNFDLSFMFIYKGGHKMRKDVFAGSAYTHKDVALRWRKPGDEKTTNVPKLSSWSYDSWYYPYMDINVVDASYVKLRDVTLTYNFPKSILDKANLSSAKVYFQARNLFKITANDSGIDPETIELNEGGSGQFTLESARRMPIMSEFYVGLSFSF